MSTKLPIADNPQHVRNLEKLTLLKEQGFKGHDASLETSLSEYGLAWREIDNETLFVYAHPQLANRYDRCTMPTDTDCRKEFDWVQWEELYAFTGSTEADWHTLPLPNRIADLVSYHGSENVFGTSYWKGFAIDFEG